METKNALITGTMLGIEEHGILTFSLYLDYGGSGQAAGGFSLDTPIHQGDTFIKRIGTAAGMSLIMRIITVVGVEKWEDLKGKYIRIKGDFTQIQAIGNVIKDDWLDFKQFFEEIKPFIQLIKPE